MRVRTFPAKLLPAAALMIFILAALTAACGGNATPTATATSLPPSTANVRPTLVSSTPISPLPTVPKPTPTRAATPIPTVITAPTLAPTATPPPTVPPTPTLTPEPAATPEPTPLPQTAALRLDVIFPPEDMVVYTDTITVTGLASPDATVSVNGNLAIPNAEGRFSLELTISPDENPLAIEVIATSVAGEELSLVRTVIFVP